MDVLEACRKALKRVDRNQIDNTVHVLGPDRRVFCVGNGGGFAHASHFASDLRKIAGRQAFAFDNVTEMTARINDDGWEAAWGGWLAAHKFDPVHDVRFMFSVGGGRDGMSPNLPDASYGIVGANGAYANRIVIPSTSTPVIEGCQSVIAHHIVEQLRPLPPYGNKTAQP